MVLKRLLTGLIWTAVLVIVAQAFSGVAVAHPGHHAHHEALVAAHASDKSAPPLEQHVASAELRVAGALQIPASAPDDGCIGGCCGIGIGCCGAALAGSFPTLPALEKAAKIVPLIVTRPPGIDPEGLARPPRFLA